MYSCRQFDSLSKLRFRVDKQFDRPRISVAGVDWIVHTQFLSILAFFNHLVYFFVCSSCVGFVFLHFLANKSDQSKQNDYNIGTNIVAVHMHVGSISMSQPNHNSESTRPPHAGWLTLCYRHLHEGSCDETKNRSLDAWRKLSHISRDRFFAADKRPRVNRRTCTPAATDMPTIAYEFASDDRRCMASDSSTAPIYILQ